MMRGLVKVALIGAAILFSAYAQAQAQEEPFDFVRASALAMSAERSLEREATASMPDSVIEGAKYRVTLLVFGLSHHPPGAPPGWFEEVNPGVGIQVSLGSCLGYFECHATAAYILRNSVKGHAATIGGGMRLELITIGKVTASVDGEAFFAMYQYPRRHKTYYLPGVAPIGELSYHVNKDTSVGVAVIYMPVGEGRSIKLYYATLTLNFER